MPPANAECPTKIAALRALLAKHQVDALLLRRVSSFAWATCGAASYINTAATEGGASLIITPDRLFLATNNIEAPRLQQEEKLEEQGWEFHVSPWETPLRALQALLAGKTLASDVPFFSANGQAAKDISAEMARLRAHLTPAEGERFRRLGRLCAETVTAAAQAIQPGMSEYELAALLGGQAQQRGVQPIVNLVAVDDRAYHFRHPLPTARKLEKYAMLVLSGRQHGLVCSISRLVHFGPPPADLAQRIHAAAQVNAAFIAHSRPGSSLRDVFAHGQQAYARAAFPDEWRHHHQGGVVGYEPREYLATPDSSDIIAVGQALSWNPTIAGAKMEDTLLVGPQTNEILTATSLWPTASVAVPGLPGEIPCALALEL